MYNDPVDASPTILNRGRGPEIAGTRITVYDVMDYHKSGWAHASIAAVLGVSSAQVLAAIQYINDHADEVNRNYQRILERSQRGNPPEIQRKLEAAAVRARQLQEALRARAAG